MLAGVNLGGDDAMSAANLATFRSAVQARSATVVFVGHSHMEGLNQNWLCNSLNAIFERELERAFPECAFAFTNLGIGGTSAGNLANSAFIGGATSTSTTFYRPASNAPNFFDSWRSPDMTLNGSTIGKSWMQHVRDLSPDLVVLLMDLNETALSSFVTAMQSILTDMRDGSGWVKKPTIVLGTSATGETNRGLILQTHTAIRSLARQYGTPLFDGGRVYEILTRGTDPAHFIASGEAGYRYNGGYGSASFTLNSTYWSCEGVTAGAASGGFSPTGSTLRDQASQTTFRFYRKRLVRNVRIKAPLQCYSASAKPEVLFRRDAAVADNTAANQYRVRLNGSNVELIKQVGATDTILTAAAMTTSVAVNSNHHVMVEAIGARIRVWVNGKLLINTRDYSFLDEGWVGVGSGQSGGSMAFNVGSARTNGFAIEYLDPVFIGDPVLTTAEAVGPLNDFTTNPDSVGGNGINHLSDLGQLLVYQPSVHTAVKALRTGISG